MEKAREAQAASEEAYKVAYQEMWAKLEATAGAAKKAAQKRTQEALASKLKADESTNEAIISRDKTKARLLKIQNYFNLVNKWFIKASKNHEDAFKAYKKASGVLIKAENKRIIMAN